MHSNQLTHTSRIILVAEVIYMKRKIRIGLCACIISVLLMSCSHGNEQELIEKYSDVEAIETAGYYAEIDWLEDETEYSYTASDTPDNIVD